MLRVRRLLAAVVAAYAAGSALANVPGGNGDHAPVHLKQQGDNYLLSNGNIALEIGGPSATLTSLKFHGRELVNQQGNHDKIYWSMDGGKSYQNPSHARCSIRVQTEDMADVGCKSPYTGAQPHAFDIDIHYVLRRGATGVYVYAILSHPASYPETSVGEWRIVWQTPSDNSRFLLERIYSDNLRHWTMPSPADYAQRIHTPIKEISILQSGPWAGKAESKYSYSATYEDIGTFGFASDINKLGAWTVLGSYEYYNDGPRKNDLTVLEGGMTHHFGRNHYGGTGIHVAAGEEWSKIFGPFLLYANEGAPADELWRDAQNQAAAERGAWPYAWMAGVTEYPGESARGSATGKLLLHDSDKPQQTTGYAWIGLAQPPADTDFQNESKNYEYWTHVRADGSFLIPHVRPGTYTLYAFVNGEVDQFERKEVTIRAGQATPLGDITWNIARTGPLAWEIGNPDRDSREFKHGNDFYTPYLYKDFANEFTNPLVFTVGSSHPATDWNYAQSNFHPVKGEPRPWPWQVRFTLPVTLPASGSAQLIVALAAANRAHLKLTVNGTDAASWTPENNTGNGLLRQASHMKYSLHRFAIPITSLHSGTNTIELLQTNWKSDDSYVSYDYLGLELPTPQP